eukprot:scpid98294/ scgid8058/ Sushi, von Willebrand factor type A, EGF and pentraxin domain-containing protein 1
MSSERNLNQSTLLILCIAAVLLGFGLDGSSAQVCTQRKSRSVQSCIQVVEHYSEKYQISCWDWDLLCTAYRDKYRMTTLCRNVSQYYTETFCCAGYVAQGSNATCVPVCNPVCHNQGRCSSPNNCTCATGWSGGSCQTPECTSPCLNGGACIAPNTCTCAAGYTGATCNAVCPAGTYGVGCKPCPCLNGGSCSKFSPTAVCSCTPGWRGTTCNQRCDWAHYGQNCASTCQ